MSIRELESLVAIADRGSITAAAESLYLSVPAVSAHIASMEERLRTKLLDRRRKPASLNAAGLLLSERARAVLRGYRDFYATSAENADLAGSLTLGAAATLLTGVIPQSLVSLRASHPRLQIRMHFGLAAALLKEVAHGEIDALACGEPPALPKGVRWTAFAHEPVMVIAPPGTRERTDEARCASTLTSAMAAASGSARSSKPTWPRAASRRSRSWRWTSAKPSRSWCTTDWAYRSCRWVIHRSAASTACARCRWAARR